MIGVMLLGLPALMGGALMLPNSRSLDRILMIARLLQPAASAIGEAVSSPLLIISWMSSSLDFARFGAKMIQSCHYRSGKWREELLKGA